jgi:hypothetical protein
MPRDGSGVYTIPSGTHGVPNTTISSTAYNAYVDDVATDLNAKRPIVAGGTGASNAPDARALLGTDTAGQLVADYNAFVFSPGSFYSAVAATNSPVAGHAFSGICYSGDPLPVPPAAPANLNLVIEARDQSDTVVPGTLYIRERKAGVWGAWTNPAAVAIAAAINTFTPPPCGRLAWVSATSLSYKPQLGNMLRINGQNYVIPSAGIAGLSNTGVFVNGTGGANLVASTDYWVYAFVNSGAVTADFRTASTHAPSATPGNEGVEILTGNDTRTLIGLVHTNSGGQFADSVTQRFVLSWFNRKRRHMLNTFTVSRTTTSAAQIEVNTEIRCEFMLWNDDTPYFSVNAMTFPGAAAGNQTFTTIGFNTGYERASVNNQGETNFQPGMGGSVSIWKAPLGEGYNFATLVGWVAPGGTTGTWLASCTLTGSVTG